MPENGENSINILPVNGEPTNLRKVGDNLSTRLYDDIRPSVVRIEAGKSVGSGFAVGKPGQIITNFHVIVDQPEIFVRADDGLKYRARVINADDIKDLAVLQIEGKAPDFLKPLKLANESTLNKDPRISAFGHPDGMPETVISPGSFLGRTSNFARLSQDQLLALSKLKETPEDKELFLKNELLNAEIQIKKGNSGGPAVNSDGNVVGVSVYRNEPPKMQAYFVPSTDLHSFLSNTQSNKFKFEYQYQLSPNLTTSYLDLLERRPLLTGGGTAAAAYLGARSISDLGGLGRGLSAGLAAYGGLGLIEDWTKIRQATNNRDLLSAGLSTFGDSALLAGGISRSMFGVGTSALSGPYLTGAGKVGLVLIGLGLAAKVASDLVPNRLVNTNVLRTDGDSRLPFYLGR